MWPSGYRCCTIYIPTKKIKDILRPAKDKFHPHKKAGVYRIPCSCGQVYIVTTKRSIATRLKEHDRNSRLGQIEKSAVAEHAALEGHTIQYDNMEVLSTALHYYPSGQVSWVRFFRGFSSLVIQMSGSFRPPRPPNIIWPSSSIHPSIHCGATALGEPWPPYKYPSTHSCLLLV